MKTVQFDGRFGMRVEIEDDICRVTTASRAMRMAERRQGAARRTRPRRRRLDEPRAEAGLRNRRPARIRLDPGEISGSGASTHIDIRRDLTPQVLHARALPVYALIVLYDVTDLRRSRQRTVRERS